MRNDRPTDAAVIELIETAKHVDALLTRNDIGNRSSSDAHPLRLRFRKAIDAFKPRTIEIGYSLTNRSHFAKDSDTALCGYRSSDPNRTTPTSSTTWTSTASRSTLTVSSIG
jgi:hypothetical protein